MTTTYSETRDLSDKSKTLNIQPIIIKRDGAHTAFAVERIRQAIHNASLAAGIDDLDYAQEAAEAISLSFRGRHQACITEIQAAVENHLMAGSYKQVARKFIEYRHLRDQIREKKSQLNLEIKGLIDQTDDDLLNENANKDAAVIPTQRDLLAGIIAKHYAKNYLLPDDLISAHNLGQIHYHDLDYAPFFPMFNCMLIDLEGMLTKGFKMGNAEIEPPKSIATATAVTAQIIAQVASHIYGGTTINRIDEVLIPYIGESYRKHLATAKQWKIGDAEAYAKLQTKKECHDAFQSLEYEVNTLHTSNGQTPFVTFGFGLGESWESRLIQKSILQVRLEGLGKQKKTAIFPKLVFAIKDGLNHKQSDPNYDIKKIALKCSATRMYPDILNYEQVVNVTGSFKSPMGCRSFLSVHKKNGKQEHEGRNNLGVVSLNLPRIALEANGNEGRFFALLNQRLSLAKRALHTRIQRLENVPAKVAPILYTEGACGVRLKPSDRIAKIFKNGRASISLGYIGIHETINALYKKESHIFESQELQERAMRILQVLRAATDQWKAESGYGFSLYSTPSENLCSRFCQLDRKDFGIIKGVTDKGYYTNSFHLDVEMKVNPYEKIDFESDYPMMANGGFICYGEYPNMLHNLEALEDVWDYSYSRIPYYGTNTPIDECYDCGYKGEFSCVSKGFTCPQCGNNESQRISVIRRVCGYLGSPNSRPFNSGKQEEVKRRVKHL